MDESNPIVAKHVRMAKTIRQLSEWRSHLIHQMHVLKSKPRKQQHQRYRMKTHADKKVYDVQLFLKLPRLTSYDIFPCVFQSELEKVMWNEIGPHIIDTWSTDDIFLYYSRRWSKETLLEGCPQLDEHFPTLTTADEQILKDFNSHCLQFVEEAIALVEEVNAPNSSTVKMKRWRRRLQNCIAFNYVPPDPIDPLRFQSII
jgi:hypothetical protein